MQSTVKNRTALARRRTLIATGDYRTFSSAELIRETIDLHRSLTSADRFGRVAELGLRSVILERLASIDREQERRQQHDQAPVPHPLPRTHTPDPQPTLTPAAA